MTRGSPPEAGSNNGRGNHKVSSITQLKGVKRNRGKHCKKGRFGYRHAHAPDRLAGARVRTGRALQETPIAGAIDYAAMRLKELTRRCSGPEMLVLVSPRLTNEEVYLAQKLARVALKTHNVATAAHLLNPGLACPDVVSTATYAEIADAQALLLVQSDLSEEHFVADVELQDGRTVKLYETDKAYHLPELVTKKEANGIRIGKSILHRDITVQQVIQLVSTGRTEVIKEMFDAKAFLFGSSTHDNDMLPNIAGFLELVKGFKPKGRMAAAFGSYGWAGGAVQEIEKVIKESKIAPEPSISVRYAPDADEAKKEQKAAQAHAKYERMPEKDLERELKGIEKEMQDAAKNLEFERAAELRDRLYQLREKLFGVALPTET